VNNKASFDTTSNGSIVASQMKNALKNEKWNTELGTWNLELGS
jgi:hypothetical protein